MPPRRTIPFGVCHYQRMTVCPHAAGLRVHAVVNPDCRCIQTAVDSKLLLDPNCRFHNTRACIPTLQDALGWLAACLEPRVYVAAGRALWEMCGGALHKALAMHAGVPAVAPAGGAQVRCWY